MFSRTVRRIAPLFAILSLISLCIYAGALWFLLQTNAAIPVLAYTTDDSYPWVPRSLALYYFKRSGYKPDLDLVRGKPVLHFVINGYGLTASSHEADTEKARVSRLAAVLLDRCANPDLSSDGLTPLHLAVLGNASAIADLLIENGANLDIRISRPASPFDGMTARELADRLAQRGKDMQAIRAVLSSPFRAGNQRACH